MFPPLAATPLRGVIALSEKMVAEARWEAARPPSPPFTLSLLFLHFSSFNSFLLTRLYLFFPPSRSSSFFSLPSLSIPLFPSSITSSPPLIFPHSLRSSFCTLPFFLLIFLSSHPPYLDLSLPSLLPFILATSTLPYLTSVTPTLPHTSLHCPLHNLCHSHTYPVNYTLTLPPRHHTTLNTNSVTPPHSSYHPNITPLLPLLYQYPSLPLFSPPLQTYSHQPTKREGNDVCVRGGR